MFDMASSLQSHQGKLALITALDGLSDQILLIIKPASQPTVAS